MLNHQTHHRRGSFRANWLPRNITRALHRLHRPESQSTDSPFHPRTYHYRRRGFSVEFGKKTRPIALSRVRLVISDGRTEGRMDGRTDKADHRVACTRLKKKITTVVVQYHRKRKLKFTWPNMTFNSIFGFTTKYLPQRKSLCGLAGSLTSLFFYSIVA